MADVEVTYRGQIIRSMSASGTEVLHTEGKLCDDDITIDYTSPGGGGANLQTKSVSYTPDETGISDTILPDPGYDGLDEVDVTVDAIPDTYIGSAIPQKTAADLVVVGATVSVPPGVYAVPASKTVQSGTAGTPTASKGAVSNHSVDVTPSVTNATGWIAGSTISGTPVSVSASELVSGSQTVTVNGTYDVTNLAEMVVNVSGGGNGPQVIASGTFVGAGRSISIPVGSVCPLKNFFVMFWSQNTELPYTTGYKIVNALSFNFGELTEFEYYDHYGLYDRYVCSQYHYTVDNSGVITPVSYNSMLDPVRYIRNDTMGQYLNTEATTPAIRKFSDHIEYFFDSHNSNYAFQSTMTYNYKLFYYGSNLSGESISV